MPLNKSKGNMYPWATHTHSHIGGECPHKCVYCYVDNPRFGRPKRYQGDLRLLTDELKVNYGTGKTIFIENCNDLFAEDVPRLWIRDILKHCSVYPDNTYVFQTKNPERVLVIEGCLPEKHIIGTTIETNRDIPQSSAPHPYARYQAIKKISLLGAKTFITLEPIMDFDLDILAAWIIDAQPDFINIGADSKNHGLQEPTFDEIMALVERLRSAGIEIREKKNLERLRI